MSKNLALCFDGTWNKISANAQAEDSTDTNVVQIFDAIGESDTQIKQYDQGVGSRWYDHALGGSTGFGIDLNIMQGYAWLADNYVDGDNIYLFGFSRGAYTARSLAGFIHRCGLLTAGNGLKVALAYEKYRRQNFLGSAAGFLLGSGAREVPIKFIGVWDTVGALGIPGDFLESFDALQYGFHDVSLHENVENAYHAISVDEHRSIFDVTLWDPPGSSATKLEQRWFVGAHADVGGGYADLHQWPRYTLNWLLRKAQECGLDVTAFDPPTLAIKDGIHDSYTDFLKGVFAKQFPAYYRAIATTNNGNEVIDDTVKQKIAEDESYQPQNAGL